jgi:CAAX protease family protein
LTLRGALFSPDGALRAPWRIVLFVVASALCAIVARNVLLDPLAKLTTPSGVTLDRDIWTLVLAMLGGHIIALRWFDPRPASYVALDRQAARPSALVAGFVLGATAIAIPVALLIGVHWLGRQASTTGSWWGATFRLSFFLLPAALWEELFSRGYIFAVLRQVWGWRAALVVTSLAFGLLHLRNPGADPRSASLVALAGIFLGAVLIATRSLYAAWMAHFAWNWTMAVLFHTAVSGFPMEAPNYKYVDTGPDWATGGEWGPEGGLAAGAGMIGGLAFLFARRRREES